MEWLILLAVVGPFISLWVSSRFKKASKRRAVGDGLKKLAELSAGPARAAFSVSPPNPHGMPSKSAHGAIDGLTFFVSRYEVEVKVPYVVQFRTPDGRYLQSCFKKDDPFAALADTVIDGPALAPATAVAS